MPQPGLVSWKSPLHRARMHSPELTGVVEHIFELTTIARLLEFLVLGQMPQVNRLGFNIPQYTTDLQQNRLPLNALLERFQLPYALWPGGNPRGLLGQPDSNLMGMLGTTEDPSHLVLSDAVNNRIKTLVTFPFNHYWDARLKLNVSGLEPEGSLQR